MPVCLLFVKDAGKTENKTNGMPEIVRPDRNVRRKRTGVQIFNSN